MASSIGVHLYDAESLAEVRHIETDAQVRSAVFSPDGELIAAGLADSTLRLWRVSDGGPLSTLESLSGHFPFERVRSVAFSPSGAVIGSVSSDGTVRLWGVVGR